MAEGFTYVCNVASFMELNGKTCPKCKKGRKDKNQQMRLFKIFCVNGLFSFLDELRGFRSPKETPKLIPFVLTMAPCLRSG